MTAIETEVKFKVLDAATLEQRLQAEGFRQETPRTFEPVSYTHLTQNVEEI